MQNIPGIGIQQTEGDNGTKSSSGPQMSSPPAISLPKGGGAIRGIGEKFSANPVTGTGSLTVPIATSPGRSGFGPQLGLSYDSGSGNGPFGLGWSLGLPSITRKSDKGLPQYRDIEESDTFILSGSEDLVPALIESGDAWIRDPVPPRLLHGQTYIIQRYRPRIEGLFGRIERWSNRDNPTDVFWRSISKDNITTWYGKDENSRVRCPGDLTQIFSWLICESYDNKGNVIVYEYKPEDSQGVDLSQVHERNRNDETRSANRYLKFIKYGNVTPDFQVLSETPPPTALPSEWLFQVVFDYGEHDATTPRPSDVGAWSCRNDPFSSYRAGFEVRTYRLCQRVLMFHHFPEEEGVGADCLVRSTDFNYSYEDDPTALSNPVFSFLNSVTQTGYRRDNTAYLTKSQPPIEFEYTRPLIQPDVHTVDPESLENLPYGLDEMKYRWVDLDGEGLSGILTQQADGWFYKRNLSPINTSEQNSQTTITAAFGPLEMVESIPSLAAISAGGQQLLDLGGDGQLDLVMLESATPGFYERTDNEQWETFRTFNQLPNLNWSDPNLKFIDLTGDGHADIMVSEHMAFTWYPSLAESGFGSSHRLPHALDDEIGPRLVFADGTESIYISDMSGDGLNDLLRIRNGEVCYWPNLGYGRFGAKVSMDNAPVFDTPDQFDRARLRLADIDGSGVVDLIYLKRDGVHLFFNQSGNSWSLGQKLDAFPQVDDLSAVQALDLLGNGTACLVWSSSLPANAQRSMRYIDLMGGQKPHLLRRTDNNLGAETVVTYAPSTRFYLADKLAGKPWITKIPFPVHVLERVETYDHISKSRFVTRYAYHHGFHDGIEREFRGFGMVEQWDTEEFASLTTTGEFPVGDNIDAASHVPPVLTKTWFHTGVYLGRDRVSNFFAGLLDPDDRGEYYREPDWRDDDLEAAQHFLDDTILPGGLTADEEREACRALKGSMLRQEIYALDGSENAEHPYVVQEQSFSVKVLQRTGNCRHAIFFSHPRESISYHYERKSADPRIAHTLTLSVDDYGSVLRSVAVGYPRADVPERHPEQNEYNLTLTHNRYANRDDQPDWRHIGLAVETSTYELVKPPTASFRFNWEELRDLFESLIPLDQVEPPAEKTFPYEQWDWRKDWNPQVEPGGLDNSRLRLIECVRTLYRPDDFGEAENDPLALLPLGIVESLALPGESYKLALTPSLLTEIYGDRVTAEMLENEGRYVHSEGDDNWWLPSGRIFYSPDSTDSSADEIDYVHQHFLLPRRYHDPFQTNLVSTESFVDFDEYDLLLMETRDALGNRVTVGERDVAGALSTRGNDYRVLQPRLMMDSNRNRTAVAFDILGMVVGTAVMGKPEENVGDSLIAFEPDLSDALLFAHLTNPIFDPQSILQRATTRVGYDLLAYVRTKNEANPQPGVVYTLARETHHNEPIPAGGLKFQHTFSYSDGLGREIQKKMQAESGPVPERDSNGKVLVGADGRPVMTTTDLSPRWVGSGWTIFNNKGKPVRQYQSFFTDTHTFEFDIRIGVSSVLIYDPLERVVATLHPNHTWEKEAFDPWRQETWDVNDTVLIDPPIDLDVGEFFQRLPDVDYLPTWHQLRESGGLGSQEQVAAEKASVHADTPTVKHFNSLGRIFLTVFHNKIKYSDTPPADPPVEEFYQRRIVFDLENNEREVVDANARVVMRYDYDMLGNRLHQASMDGGERWELNDVAGKPLYKWNSRNQIRNAYDPLQRPTDSFLRDGADAEVRVIHTVYGESAANPEASNLRQKVAQLFDQAGVVTNDQYDFKGNLLESRRQLAEAYNVTLNWSGVVPLQSVTYFTRTRYDALNRASELSAPDNSVIRTSYNEANLLERVDINLRGAEQDGQPVWTNFVTDIDYDANGQRKLIDYGNGVRTTYEYDSDTLRLVHLLSTRNPANFPDDCPGPPLAAWPGCEVQSLHHTYDPVGNITHVRDDAQQTIYFLNKRVEPTAEYTYDATYRLIEATGREHLGQVGAAPSPSSYNDRPRINILLSESDGNAVGRYLERYVYDASGNFQQMIHRGSDPVNPGWTRNYSYNDASLLEPATPGNRLTSTTIGTATETYSTGGDGYDTHGNMLRMPQLQAVQWNFLDQLQMTQRQAVNDDDVDGLEHQGERTWYVYDAGGLRVRKITELATGQIRQERVYLGGFEVYSRSGVAPVVRETLHIMDDRRRIALVETRTQGDGSAGPAQLIRYQLSNHLHSSSLELDNQAQVISYEEYTPYGSTSYQAVRSQTETPKRYRYSGKERDEESGLYAHGVRYFIPWLARWSSVDPVLFTMFESRGNSGKPRRVSLNPYEGMANNPLVFVDPDGGQETAYTRYLDRQLATPEGASRLTGIPLTPPDPLELTARLHGETQGRIQTLEHEMMELGASWQQGAALRPWSIEHYFVAAGMTGPIVERGQQAQEFVDAGLAEAGTDDHWHSTVLERAIDNGLITNQADQERFLRISEQTRQGIVIRWALWRAAEMALALTPVRGAGAGGMLFARAPHSTSAALVLLNRGARASGIGGVYKNVIENMSLRAIQFQELVSGGIRAGTSFVRNGVKFDFLDAARRVLVDAKGPGYANFVDRTTGEFYTWFAGRTSLVDQARRQIAAAGGTPIEWVFAERQAMVATRRLLQNAGVTGISLRVY